MKQITCDIVEIILVDIHYYFLSVVLTHQTRRAHLRITPKGVSSCVIVDIKKRNDIILILVVETFPRIINSTSNSNAVLV
jgi:hypothetical protein